jgi:hypothetical protein
MLQIGHPDEQDDAAQHDQHTKHSSGTAVAAGTAGTAGAAGGEEDEEEDSDDEDDEDFDPGQSDDEGAGQGPPAKKAKVEAAQKQGERHAWSCTSAGCWACC